MLKVNHYLKIVIFLLLLVFLATFLIHKINLPTDDLGRHIKTGQIIWQTKSVPKINLFSYAETNHSFTNHHWLSELIFYHLYNLIGFTGLIILKIILLLLAFAIFYYLAIHYGNFWWATIFAFLAIPVFIQRTDVRPEIFSYFILALFFLIFHLYHQGKTKYLYLLIPLQLLWVNLHIYFFLGPFLILVFFIQPLINQQNWWLKLKSYFKPQANALLWVVLLIFLVLLINPNFIHGALYPLFVLANYGYDIVENKSPFYLDDLMDNPSILYFKILITLTILGLILNHRRTTFFNFITASSAIFLGWFALRNLPLTALLTLPVLSTSYTQSFNNLFTWLKKKLTTHLIYIEITLAVSTLIFLVLITHASLSQHQDFAFTQNKEWGIGLTQSSEHAAKFYLAQNISGPVFNNFDIGSYLDFYLYPQKTFVDNRPEAFTPEFWQYVYIPAQTDQDWWQVFDAHYDFNSIFFGHTDGTGWAVSFLKRITSHPDWTAIYLDQHAIILLKNLDNNKSLIDKFAIPQTQVKNTLKAYQVERLKVDNQLQAQREKGLKYIRANFGNLGSL